MALRNKPPSCPFCTSSRPPLEIVFVPESLHFEMVVRDVMAQFLQIDGWSKLTVQFWSYEFTIARMVPSFSMFPTSVSIALSSRSCSSLWHALFDVGWVYPLREFSNLSLCSALHCRSFEVSNCGRIFKFFPLVGISLP